MGGISQFREQVFDIAAAGHAFFQEGLDVSESFGILVRQPVPPFGILLSVEDEVNAGRGVRPKISIRTVPQLPEEVGPQLLGLFQRQLAFLVLPIDSLEQADGRFNLRFDQQIPVFGFPGLGRSRNNRNRGQ